MGRAIIILSVLFAVAFPAAAARQPGRARAKTFAVRFPQEIDTAGLSIRYLLTGRFGGYGGFVRTQPGVRSYQIETSYEGRPASALKVYVYCPGYAVETFDVPRLAAAGVRGADVRLKPLATLPFSGRVVLPGGADPGGLRLVVDYEPFWECEFFEHSDCLTAGLRVASVELDAGGAFSVEVPDFAHDPLVSTFRRRGEFNLRLMDRRGGKNLYWLRPRGGESQGMGVPVGAEYAEGQVFVAERDR